VVTGAVSVLRENTDLARVECRTKIAACKTKADLSQLAAQLAEMMTSRLALARDVVRSHFDAQADRGTQDLERNVLQALRVRYYILHEVKRPADLRVVVDAPLVKPAPPAHLATHFEGIVRSFDRVRMGFGIGGAILGAALGTLILPGIGSLVGALLGGLATFARTLGTLRRDFSAACDESIAGLEREMATQIVAMEPSVATVVRTSLAKSLEHALARFAHFIDEPIEEERAAIEREREKLDELKKLTQRLREQDFRLELLMKRATDASVGLCR
jgi:RNA polymerase-binding transcription factor DksA